MDTNCQLIPITYEKSPLQPVQKIQDYVWGRKRSFLERRNDDYLEMKRVKASCMDVLDVQMKQLNQSLHFCGQNPVWIVMSR